MVSIIISKDNVSTRQKVKKNFAFRFFAIIKKKIRLGKVHVRSSTCPIVSGPKRIRPQIFINISGIIKIQVRINVFFRGYRDSYKNIKRINTWINDHKTDKSRSIVMLLSPFCLLRSVQCTYTKHRLTVNKAMVL